MSINRTEFRTGFGYDVHAFGEGDHVVLGGVKVSHNLGLLGHSDADVILHSLTDALLGAMALGDIGQYFPPSDPQWKGANSAVFLKHAVKLIEEKGARFVNADVTLIGERPKLNPHREKIRENLAHLLNCDLSRVSVKATTTEKLGFTGREEGLAAQAVVTVEL